MIKECKVILHNDKVAVVLFDDKKIHDFDKSIKQSKSSKWKAEETEDQATNKGIVMDNEGWGI